MAAPRSMQGLELVGKIKGLRMWVPSKLIRKLIKKKKRFKKISMEYSLFLKG